jgi:hypothetical protein
MSAFEGGRRKLMEAMWRISEEAWSAGWMKDLEFHLWRIVLGGPEKYGHMLIDGPLILELKSLSDQAGGWILYDAVDQETWIDKAAWTAVYDEWKSAQPPA